MAKPVVPLVDLEAFGAGEALDAALRRFGFVQIIGHGVDAGPALWSSMDELFAQPLAVKQGWVCDEPLSNRGYRQRGSESLAYSLGEEAAAPDLFESFNVRLADRAGDHPLLPEPLWPAEVPVFRDAARAYQAQMTGLAARLDRIIGAVIGIDDLDRRSTAGPDAMACIRYQRGDDEYRPDPGQARMGAHSDYTTFTILRADPVPGLEILTGDGWLPVVPEDEALLLNVGDLLAMWTNDTWPSTVHRVPLHGDDRDPELRRSVAYFHYPDLDQVVAPLGPWVEGEARYQPTTVEEHLAAKLVGPKLGRRSEGAVTLGRRRLQ